jgi:hypothetical protein
MFRAIHYAFGATAVAALLAAMYFVPVTMPSYARTTVTPRIDATAIMLTAKDLPTQSFDAI